MQNSKVIVLNDVLRHQKLDVFFV